MSRLSRFLPKFLRGDKSGGQKAADKSQCKIMFLDDTEYFIPYKGGFKGQYALDKAFEQLNLFEKDYFGLRFIDLTGQTHWLDCNKTLSAQLKGCSIPYTLYFGVKFYPADPCKLKEEITRYEFFLQVKRDILHGRLPVTFEDAAELFAYAVQSELGDFESQTLPPGYVSEFQFVPNQTEELEEQITHLHRRLGGTVPATAELKFLDKVKWLDMYGVDLHPVIGESNTEYFLGLTPTGIVVYKNKTKVGNYFWPRITKVNMKGKVFIARVKDKINEEHMYAFELSTKAACKHLWKCCLEHHNFFRINQLGATTARTSKPYRSTAKHRNSGRQDRQNTAEQNGREQPQVLRVQSRRQARRAMSDTRLNHGDVMTGIQYSEGHVTMVVNPEQVKGSRHRSLPDLKGRGSPQSTRSAPWENNMDAGLYTSGRESPVSVTQSENVNYLRRHRDSDSEGGYRRKIQYQQIYHTDYQSQQSLTGRSGYDSDALSSRASVRRRKYFPSSRKGSDNESDVSFSRRRRRDGDSGSESDVSPKYTARQRKTKSVGADNFEREWNDAMQHMYVPDKENRQNGSTVHSAPLGESRQKKMRRRRSKSPGNKRPPEELRQHIAFDLVEPPDEMTEDQLREIPYVNVETKADAFKVKYSPSNRRRYRSPKRKSMGDLEYNVKNGYNSDVQSQKYNHTPERTPEPVHKQFNKQTAGYYSDTGSASRRGQNLSRYNEPQFNNTLPSHSKPIDSTTDQRNNTSMHSMSEVKVNDRHSNNDLDTDPQGQDHSDIGQGHTGVDDRLGDRGLNNSQGSVGTFMNTPPHSKSHKFGTQDAIARLYSSPGGNRKPIGIQNQQNDRTTNQNTSYNRNIGLTNENSGYNQSSYNRASSANQHASYNLPERSQYNSNNYDNNSNVVKTVNSHGEPFNHSGVQYQRDRHYHHQQQQQPDPVIPTRQPLQNGGLHHNQQKRQQHVYSSNKFFYSQDENDGYRNDLAENSYSARNDLGDNSFIPNGGYPAVSSGYNQHQTMLDTSVKSHSPNKYPPPPSYDTHNYNDGNQSNLSSQSQSRFSPQKQTNNYSGNQSSSTDRNQSGSHDRLGLQQSWQYVNGGSRYPNRNGPENGNLNGQKSTPNLSTYNRSPAQSAGRRNRQIEMTPTHDSRNMSANQSGSNMRGNFQSPDSAISSLTSLSLANVTRSPNKNTQRSATEAQSSDNFSRTRTPAFGRSDIWTEL